MQYICLDIECTGLDLRSEQIIEIAAAKFDNDKIIDTWQSFIAHDKEIPENIQILTGITPDMTANAPTLESVKEGLIKFVADAPIIGHNINFDLNFLKANNVIFENLRVDTLPYSEMTLKSGSYSLEMLSKKFNQTYFPSHRALDDVLANIELFWTIQKTIQQLPSYNQAILETVLNPANPLENIILKSLTDSVNTNLTTPNYQLAQPIIIPAGQTHNQAEVKQLAKSYQNTLFVMDHNQFGDLDPSYEAYPISGQNSYISAENFLNNHQKGTNWILKAKIACKLDPDKATFLRNLNLRNQEYNETHLYCSDGYSYELKNNYQISYYDFFKMLKLGVLPNVNEVVILEQPYFIEEYIKSQETKLYTHKISDEVIQNQFQEFIEKNFEKGGYFRSDHLLEDPFLKHDQRLANMIKACLKQQNLNPNLAENKLISISISQNQAPMIKLLDHNLYLKSEDLYPHIPHKLSIFKPAISSDIILNHPKNIHNQSTEQISFILKQIKNIENSNGILIISSNLQQIKEIYCELHQSLDTDNYTLLAQNQSGSKSKILETMTNNQKPYILICTHHFLLKFQPKLNNLQIAIITKLPIGLPTHYYYNYLKNQDQNQFMNLTLPHTAYTIGNICQQLHYQNQINHIDLLDDRILSTSWGKTIAKHLPTYVQLQS